MHCPNFHPDAEPDTVSRCEGHIVPFEPSAADRADFCTSGRHRQCPLFRQASRDLRVAIRREVSRAIG